MGGKYLGSVATFALRLMLFAAPCRTPVRPSTTVHEPPAPQRAEPQCSHVIIVQVVALTAVCAHSKACVQEAHRLCVRCSLLLHVVSKLKLQTS